MKIGDAIGDLALKDQHNHEFKLSDHKGKKVLLSFHPLAWTKICAQQMQSLEKNQARFESLNAVAVGLSVDTVPSKHAWAKELGITKTRLLSDFWPHGEVARQLGLFRENDGFSQRANIIVDESGTVVWLKIYDIPQLPDIEEVISVLQ
jgi:peroxiredoxin